MFECSKIVFFINVTFDAFALKDKENKKFKAIICDLKDVHHKVLSTTMLCSFALLSTSSQ